MLKNEGFFIMIETLRRERGRGFLLKEDSINIKSY
jgi:hypothetical protein